ncbi:MAG: UDP-N-acetylglucosamine--N-acetylmuramyl-(pentapeptide) pyrophosphoryl-undecaprenol N-acetylglucosamine transferase [Candidatus Omnitrophota bacterium]|nr:MAG: UDP-N-acetylglucosamine--N-acetylmuramyl-(pentapeptide) pyrophosphoryl-undecaprenol N-acetylglucosamine transferase [Candidatus Omnitrophota bacterium]
MRLLLVCERSGGHIFPALALARELRKDSELRNMPARAYFFVTSLFLKKIVEREKFVVYGKSFPFRNLIIEVLYRAIEAPFLLLRIRPKKVIGFGGRDSFFLILWAKILFIETVLYEPNFTLGRANKLLSLFVKKIYCGFQETQKLVKGTRFAGIPLRSDLRALDKSEAKKILGFNSNKLLIAAIGGSQGSRFINEIFLKLILSLSDDVQVIHLTGRKEYAEISKFYSKINKKVIVKDFWVKMDLIYSAADILVSRAGAITLGEIIHFRVPAVLIPHPQAFSHQSLNARYLEERGCAAIFSQQDFSFKDFKKTVEGLITDRTLREKIIENIRKINFVVSSGQFYKNIFS